MHRIYVQTASISTSTMPQLGERNHLILDITLSDRQLYEAICVLLGSMPEAKAADMIRSEFPELLATKEAA